MKDIYEYAVEYCGDPASHEQRGRLILSFLQELGLEREHRVLNIGCGALSEGAPLIRYLDPARYTGLDPNGWLIRAALDHEPELVLKNPAWREAPDFTASGGPFNFLVSHSVLSHVAHWQLELALANVRQIVEEGAVWLASIRLDQYDAFAKDWVYPGNSYFRRQTLQALGYYFGWHVQFLPELRERMVAVCPNDIHDWVAFHAVPSSVELNNWRLQMEADRREKEEREAIELAYFKSAEQARLVTLEAEAAAQ